MFFSNILIVSLVISLTHGLLPNNQLLENVLPPDHTYLEYVTFYKSISQLLSRHNWLKLISNPALVSSDKTECLESFRRFNTSIKGRPEDIIYLFDSFAKPQPGMLTGNVKWVGNWGECKSLNNTRYITLTMPVAGQQASIDICLPAECDNSTIIKQILRDFGVNKTENIEIFTHLPHEMTPGRYAVLFLLCIFFCLITISTAVDFIERAVSGINNLLSKEYTRRSVSQIPNYNYQTGNEIDSKLANISNSVVNKIETDLTGKNDEANEYSKLLRSETYSRSVTKRATNVVHILTQPFSLYNNVQKVFDTYQPPAAIRCLNGIRTLSMFWVILGHSYLFALPTFTNLMSIFTDVAPRFSFQPVSNGYYSVDSFFVLSGLLVMYLSLRELSRTRKTSRGYILFLIKFYAHRVLRITPTLFVVLVFFWQLMPLISDGPLWRKVIDSEVALCNGINWIFPLLYLNNFYPNLLDSCMGWTWYLANDMQFFLISPIFIFPAFFLSFPFPLIPLGVCVVIFLIPSLVIPVVYNLHSNFYFPLNHLEDGLYEVAANMTHGDLSNYYYIKPYCRINPYLIGMALGYIIYKVSEWKRESGDKRSLQLRLSILDAILWPISFGICFGLVYGLYPSYNGHIMTELENAIYLGLSRTLWGLGLSFFIFICYSGMGGPVNSFLSWGVFVPLSRLTFSAYLIHPVIILVFQHSLQDRITYTDITYAFLVVGLVAMSYAAAAIIAICIEFPLSNVEDLILKRKKKERQRI